MDNPEVIIMKAVDVETNEIAACALWQLCGYGTDTKDTPYIGAAGMILLENSKNERSSLGDYIKDNINEYRTSWFQKTKYLYVAALFTDPRFQRRGYATALMNYGHSRADQDKVPAVLIATPVGHPLYLSLGWKEIPTGLKVDLRKFVPYADKGDRKSKCP